MNDKGLAVSKPKQQTPWETDESAVVFDHRLHRGQRCVPMKVLVLGWTPFEKPQSLHFADEQYLGLSRTGTLSIRHALFQLGYFDVYHGTSFGQEDSKGSELWMKAVQAKYEGGPPLSREDWEDLLGHCMAVADLPCYLFASELIQLYPNAKVILSVRDSPEVWRASMLKTTVPTARSATPSSILAKCLASLALWNPCTPVYMKLIKYARILDTEWDGIRIYEDHNAFVKRLVPPDRLLEFNVKEGWKPLCEFLGHWVPHEPFPKVNDEETYKMEMGKMFQRQWSVIMKRLMWIVVACFIPIAASLVWSRMDSQ